MSMQSNATDQDDQRPNNDSEVFPSSEPMGIGTVRENGPVVVTVREEDARAAHERKIPCVAVDPQSISDHQEALEETLPKAAAIVIVIGSSQGGERKQMAEHIGENLHAMGVHDQIFVASLPVPNTSITISLAEFLDEHGQKGFQNTVNDPENLSKIASQPSPSRSEDSNSSSTNTEQESSSMERTDEGSNDNYKVELPAEKIRSHYERIRPVLEELGEIDVSTAIGQKSFPTMGVHDHAGWYMTSDAADDPEYPLRRRPIALEEDYEYTLENINRTLYALTSYKEPATVFDGWTKSRCLNANNGQEITEWPPGDYVSTQFEYPEGVNNPMPEITAIRGWSVWGDIDLADELKPQRRDLPKEKQEIAEKALEAYAEKIGERFYNDADAVYGLDSVGGAYIMGPPAATLPIVSLFMGEQDDNPMDKLSRAFNHFDEVTNSILSDIQDEVNEEIPHADEVIEPDWVNNKNRQYKAPLSIHADHPGVVTPFDTTDVSYEFTHIDDVTDEHIQDAKNWAVDLTSDAHTRYAEPLVAAVWNDEYEAANGDWRAALDSWIETQREKEEQARLKREQRKKRRRERRQSITNTQITPFIDDVYDALEDLRVERVAEDTIVHQWTDSATGYTDNSGSNNRAFIPIWGTNANSGNANFVSTDRGIWVDSGNKNVSGGPVKMALISEESWSHDRNPSGEDWRRGVQYLRDMGYNIPVWTPDANSESKNGVEYGEMPFWAVRKAAVTLGIIEQSEFEEKETDNGSTYLKFPSARMYNRALAGIEAAGLEHGREYMSDDGEKTRDAEQTYEEMKDKLGN